MASAADPAKETGAMLTSQKIYASSEYQPKSLPLRVWSQRSDAYFSVDPITAPNKAGEGENSKEQFNVVRVDTKSGQQEIIIPAAALIPAGSDKPLAVEGLQFTADEKKVLIYTNTQRVWRQRTRGDYWVFDRDTKALSKIGGQAEPSTLKFAKFSPTGVAVAYVHHNNIYHQRLSDNRITQLTKDGSAIIINGTGDWVNEEELYIRDGYRWSPDGQTIAFWQFDTSGVPQFHLLDNTAGLYPIITSFAYPKVGQTNSATRIGLINVADEATDEANSVIRWLPLPGDPREHYVSSIQWQPGSSKLLVQHLNRQQNTCRLFMAEAQSATLSEIITERDEAWLDGDYPPVWVRKGKSFLWLSERDGWRHIYEITSDGKKTTLLTTGNYDVLQIEDVDAVNEWVYFSASPDNPTQRYLFRMSLNGGEPQRLSPSSQAGWHTYQFSSDSLSAWHTYANFSTPPTTNLIRLSDHQVIRPIPDQDPFREKFASISMPQSSLFRIAISDEVSLDAWRLCPPNFDPKRTYPTIMYVYGEPAGQSVRDNWGGSPGLWHWMLAQRGYIVISVDPRGANAPRGRAWRKSIYRKIGIIAPEDIASAMRAMIKQWSFIDPKRIGLWGWSGGGSNTLHGIFRYPELFSTAIAVAPNPSQLLYDTIYQERYMDLLENNAEGYRLGSPITYAEQLQGNLLLIHGTGDDNGHFQGTEVLMNKLIAKHKKFSLMAYPARSHSLAEGDNTKAHFYDLMTRYFDEHLQPDAQGK
jgi:dipeptidyl-peptidase-4